MTETAGDRWAPIVVDQPVFAFEPRPDQGRNFRSDISADGWSTRTLTVRAASVRGYSHRYQGAPRQDEFAVAAHPDGTVVFAVADGVSSATESDTGAWTACRTVLTDLLRALDQGVDPVPWHELVTRTAGLLVERARRRSGAERGDPAEAERLFATTLVAGTVRPTPDGHTVSLVQVGDSSAWVLHAGRYVPVLSTKSTKGGEVLSHAVVPLPRVPADLRPVEFTLPPDGVLLVGTDGFADPLGDGTGLVGKLFGEGLAAVPPPLGMAHLLDFSRETFDDDRTLVAIWPREPQ